MPRCRNNPCAWTQGDQLRHTSTASCAIRLKKKVDALRTIDAIFRGGDIIGAVRYDTVVRVLNNSYCTAMRRRRDSFMNNRGSEASEGSEHCLLPLPGTTALRYHRRYKKYSTANHYRPILDRMLHPTGHGIFCENNTSANCCISPFV